MKRSNRYLFLLIALAVAAAVIAVTVPTLAGRERDREVSVFGGWEATFDDVPGLSSLFSVAATVDREGADGLFTCEIIDVVIISGDVQDGHVNRDGSVTLTGVGHGYDYGVMDLNFEGPFEDCPFSVTLWPGGPGRGRFLYADCVAVGDRETVSHGRIIIQSGVEDDEDEDD